MSARTVFNPARFISSETLRRVKSFVEVAERYASNIESDLRARGENELADTMLAEIEQQCEEQDARREETDERHRVAKTNDGFGN